MEKHIFKKKYGQNFLQDETILQKIYSCVNVDEKDLIIEIGPGSGNLTKWLKKYHSYLIAYEIDESLREKLNKYEDDKCQIIFNDFLTADVLNDIKKINYENIYVIANIPYYITTPIIKKIIENGLNPKEIILMVQKEVAQRLSAEPRIKNYGYFTVFLNYYFNIKTLFNVSKFSFYPVPKVDSSIIRLARKSNLNIDINKFDEFISNAFKYKRKTLKNNLNSYNLEKINEILNKYNLSINNRAEEIPVEVYIEIINYL